MRAIGILVLAAIGLTGAEPGAMHSAIVELRQYTLKPGQRDVLITLFEREFVESQEALGMKIAGTFRDLDKPDRFVWLRGFDNMDLRPKALEAFYSGPVWRAHREAANATMIDSTNVLLLRAADPGSAFAPAARPRPPQGATDIPRSLVVATIYSFDRTVDAEFITFFEKSVRPLLIAAGATLRGAYVSETTANNFPRLPVRETDRVFVWFGGFRDSAAYDHFVAELARSSGWRAVEQALRAKLTADPQALRLQPTARSELRD
jgi:NIPSNAP